MNEQARRILFSTTAGYGHFHPLVPLAQALKQAGHTVAFATSAHRQAMIEAAGFSFFPVSTDRAPDPEYQQFKAQQRTMALGLESEVFSYPRLFAGIGARLRTPSMVKLAREWQPDMIVREAGEYSAVITAEYLGLPHATVAFATALQGMALFEREVAAQIAPVRAIWGLPPDSDGTAIYRYLHLVYSPPSFSLHDVGSPTTANAVAPTTHFIRPAVFDQADNEKLPDWIDTLPPQPTVYLTLGTVVNSEPELYPSVLQTLINGLRDAPINLIVTLGRDKDPADFGPQPDNVHIEPYIPQSLLLPRCDLLVMHGGSNSVLAALDAGLPMVVVPLIADQFFNAHVVQSMGLGRVVQREQLTPATIRVALDDVLANPLYRQNVARLQAEMFALPDQRYAAQLVETVVATGAPLLNTSLATSWR